MARTDDLLPSHPRGPYTYDPAVEEHKVSPDSLWQHEDYDHRWLDSEEKTGAGRAHETLLDDRVLHPGTIIEALNVARGVKKGEAGDGDAVSFSPVFPRTPAVVFGMGGKTYLSTIVGDQMVTVRALNLSASGFTLSARISGTVGTLTTRTASFSGTDATKSQAAEAYNQTYRFYFSVALPPFESPPPYVTLEFWTNDGSGWVSRGYRTYTNTWDDPEVEDYIDIVVAGMGAGDQFRITIAEQSGGAPTVTRDRVEWEEGSAPTSYSMTSGATKIPFTAISGT